MDGRDPRTHAIIGAAMEVHQQLGSGFLELVYQDALTAEFELRGIPFEREPAVPVFYKGAKLAASYRPDFVCFDAVVVETKAVTSVGGPEEAQVINYLKATGYQVGLLLNFGTPRLGYTRFVLSPSTAERGASAAASDYRA